MCLRLSWFICLFLTALLVQAQSTPQDSVRVVGITHDSTRIVQLARLGVKTVYAGTGGYRKALPYLLRAEEEARQLGSLLVQTHVMKQRAEIEQAAGHWPAALTLLQQAERNYTQLTTSRRPDAASNRYFVLLAKIKIAQLYTDTKKYAETRQTLMEALKYARDQQLNAPDEKQLAANIYNGLSILEGKLNHQELSLAYADTSALQSKAAGDEDGYYVSLLNTAITRKNLGQYAVAVQQYKACARYFAIKQDTFGLMMVYANMPRALMGLKRYDQGISYARKAIEMAYRVPDRLAVQSDVNEALSQLYERKGDYAQALAAFRLSKAQQDTLFTADKDRQVQELMAKYETEKKEAQIQTLNEKTEQRTWQVGLLLIGALLLALLLALSLYQSKRLQQGSQRIRRQTNQLQLLMKELHHRAKNNLAIVSGLLELQANRTEDGHTKQAFREGQQRINAMSLIHQRLYQTDELTAIDLRDYVTDLVKSLMNTYGYTPTTLDLNLMLDADAVEADVAIPIGLIINELLTNSFKYAFQTVNRPSLSVTLESSAQTLLLEIADNGPGVNLTTWNTTKGSFGKQLIRSLSHQLDADLTVKNWQGTHVRLKVPLTAVKRRGSQPAGQPA